MMDRTTAYADLVCSGLRIASKAEYSCCKRHLDDMGKKDFPYIFDVQEAEKHIDIANNLTIGEGEELQKLTTRGFQNFIIGNLFGWRKKGAKGHRIKRRYREAYIQIGRQNGKSFLAGELCNDFATFSGYQWGRIFCAATKQAQANIVWDEVDKFIESDADLKNLYKITKHSRIITSLVTGSYIKAIGRDTKSADGFRSILAVVDEYHAHQTNQMYKLLLDGQIRVDNALTFAITTAGFNLNGPCYEQYRFCKQVLSGAVTKDSLFIYIAELDLPDPKEDQKGYEKALWDPQNWAKANPLNLWKSDTELDEGMIARMAEKAIEAKVKGGSDLVNFETKSLNTWVTNSEGSLVDLTKWHKCASDLTLDDMRGKGCYLGIDLSSGGDLTSIALLFPLEKDKSFLWSHSFMPRYRLAKHEQQDEAPYRVWVNQGFITLTEGEGTYGIKTDYKYILQYLNDLKNSYGITFFGCGYDLHNAAAFLADLDPIVECDLTEIVQSARSLNDATKDFQLAVQAGTILYNRNDALLTWSMVNATLVSNSFNEVKIEKMQDKKRIDPCDAVMDAWKLYFGRQQDQQPNAEEDLSDWLEMTTGEGGAKNAENTAKN